MRKELLKHSFLKSAQGDENKGLIICSFWKRLKRVREARENVEVMGWRRDGCHSEAINLGEWKIADSWQVPG
jgi:hypothetical protein